jgi:hypothetical protein
MMVKKLAKMSSGAKSAFLIGLKVFAAKLIPGLDVAPCKKNVIFAHDRNVHESLTPFISPLCPVTSTNTTSGVCALCMD